MYFFLFSLYSFPVLHESFNDNKTGKRYLSVCPHLIAPTPVCAQSCISVFSWCNNAGVVLPVYHAGTKWYAKASLLLCPGCLNAAGSCCLRGWGLAMPLLHFTLNIITDFVGGGGRGWEGVRRWGRKEPSRKLIFKKLITIATCRTMSPKLGGSSQGEPEKSVIVFQTSCDGISSK